MTTRRRALAIELVLLLGVFALYLATATRTVQPGDSGELASVAETGAVPHPSGYPLMLIWFRVWSWLPASTPAHRAGLATALSGGLAIGAVYVACRAWGATRAAGWISALSFALSPLAWRLATEPEVFMLNVALTLTIVAASAPSVDDIIAPGRRAALLGLLGGLALSNHLSSVLVAPLGLAAAIASVRASPSRLRASAGAIVALAMGLSPYLYLIHAARSSPSCSWGDPSTLSGLLHHFLRSDYGTFKLAASSDRGEPTAQLWALSRALMIQSYGLVVAALAAAAIIRRRAPIRGLMLVASVLLAGPVFIARFNLPPHGLSARIVERFYLLPLSLLAVLAAMGVTALIGLSRRRPTTLALFGALGLVLAGRAIATSTERMDEGRYRGETEAYLYDVLRLAPPRAILVMTGDDAFGGMLYAQCALGVRRDVTVIAPHLMLADWYWPRVAASVGRPDLAHGVRPSPGDAPVLNAAELLSQLLETERPVLLNMWFVSSLSKRFHSYPIGPVVHVVTKPEEVPSPDQLFDDNTALFATLTAPKGAAPPPDTWAGTRRRDYARPWSSLATAFDRAKDPERAARCRAVARALVSGDGSVDLANAEDARHDPTIE